MIGELTIAAAWLADRRRFRALIVTGAGKAFSAGGDVNWFVEGVEDRDEHRPALRRAARRRGAAPGDRRLPAASPIR